MALLCKKTMQAIIANLGQAPMKLQLDCLVTNACLDIVVPLLCVPLQVRLVLEYCDMGCLRDALDDGAFRLPGGS